MPMPPHVQMRLIKKSLAGKEGSERVKLLQQHLAELSGYMSGPYGKIRAWLKSEIDRSRAKAKVKHRDSWAIPKEGDRQVALVGAPNAGKSALLQALSGRQLKVAAYPFATLKPTAAVVWLEGAAFQLVEVPGIIAGAGDDRGGGRALLGVLRNVDYVLYLASLGEPVDALAEVRAEIALAGIDKPAALCLTGADLPGGRERAAVFRAAYPELTSYAVCSSATGEGLDDVRGLLWATSGLIRVWPADAANDRPFVLADGATVADLARLIHKDVAGRLRGARVWGASAKFPAQQVGAGHCLADGDRVELVLAR